MQIDEKRLISMKIKRNFDFYNKQTLVAFLQQKASPNAISDI